MSFLNISLIFGVLFVVCHQSTGRVHFKKEVADKELRELKELETIEEIERLLKARKEKEFRELKSDNAAAEVVEALQKGVERTEKLKRKQKKFKQSGVDGKKKKGRRNRLFKANEISQQRQEDGFTLLSAKKALVELTGKSLKELAADKDIRAAWNELLSSDTESKRNNRSGQRAKRSSTNFCTSTLDCTTVQSLNKYRTIDGTCNNLVNTTWGAAFTIQPRFLDEVYADSVNEPRLSIDGSDLPSPRVLSNTLFAMDEGDCETALEGFNSLMSFNWGQFIDHDIVLTPTFSGEGGAGIECCENNKLPIDRDECMAIEMTADDKLPITCMEFVRSAPATDCELADGNQVTNEITSFIDGSMVYGSTATEQAELRDDTDPSLLKIKANSDNLLPEDTSDDAVCVLDGDNTGDYCQLAGDVRVNVQPGLAGLHLLFVREHNRIVGKLKEQDFSSDTDELYNEARKIVGAILQHITYNEWFANVLPNSIIKQYGLSLLTEGHSADYDDTIDPAIRVGFATAALRFGHSQIPSKLAYMADDYKTLTEETDMHLTMKNPHMLVNEAGSRILDLVRYMTNVQASKADSQIEDAARNRLFNGLLDLISLNIQRGRDHGLPSYTEWREFCGLSIPSSDNAWNELSDIGSAKRDLRDLYKSVYDIDLFVGGMAEKRIQTESGDATYVGNTFACILGLQFKYLKVGDRFWYERPQPEGFTTDQLNEIRQVSLASLLCENIDGMTEVQRNAMRNSKNKRPCSRTNTMEFSPWSSTKK